MSGGGEDVAGRGGLGVGWGGLRAQALTSGVSDVMADSLRGKLQGLASLVPGTPVF